MLQGCAHRMSAKCGVGVKHGFSLALTLLVQMVEKWNAIEIDFLDRGPEGGCCQADRFCFRCPRGGLVGKI